MIKKIKKVKKNYLCPKNLVQRIEDWEACNFCLHARDDIGGCRPLDKLKKLLFDIKCEAPNGDLIVTCIRFEEKAHD